MQVFYVVVVCAVCVVFVCLYCTAQNNTCMCWNVVGVCCVLCYVCMIICAAQNSKHVFGDCCLCCEFVLVRPFGAAQNSKHMRTFTVIFLSVLVALCLHVYFMQWLEETNTHFLAMFHTQTPMHTHKEHPPPPHTHTHTHACTYTDTHNANTHTLLITQHK